MTIGEMNAIFVLTKMVAVIRKGEFKGFVIEK